MKERGREERKKEGGREPQLYTVCIVHTLNGKMENEKRWMKGK